LEPPSISDITQKRLELQEIKTYHAQDIIKELTTETEEIEVTTFNPNIMLEFIDIDESQLPVTTLLQSSQEMNMEDFMLEYTVGDLLGSIQTVKVSVSARLIWLRLSWLKHLLIAHQILNDMKMNKTILMSSLALYDNDNIFFALLKHYDLQIVLSDHDPPEDLLLSVNKKFVDKFKLKLRKYKRI